ncbi:MAG: metal ABC transporter permease [candidate division Zixibacteria bacterium]|nr:metal ABC transporter permease [candidate division Zixibacteria bacterium]MCI0595437.1 metal ABC transporter permease [candidate division Zixibacteria bacterium]
MIDIFRLPFLFQAFVACLVLALVLPYFGLHVVRRRIVFVDLAIAQISAVGVAVAVLLEKEPTLYSLLFTLAGAGLLSFPERKSRVPQEAIMGIVYAAASAVAILIVSQSPHGEADVLKIFFGNILAAEAGQLFLMAGVLLAVLAFHLIFYRRFVSLSFEEGGEVVKKGLWNLLFYLTLGLCIALAIRTAGVLLVFTYLIVPSVAAFLVAERFWRRFWAGLGFAVLASYSGLYFSYKADLPTGSTLVATFGLILLVVFLVERLVRIFGRGSAGG